MLILLWGGCNVPCWPLVPFVGCGLLMAILWVAGLIFSLVMVVDCLKRPNSQFYNPLTKDGEYDKLIWAAAIVVTLWFNFIGAIVYYFVVKRAGPRDDAQGG